MQMSQEHHIVLSWIDKIAKPVPVKLFTMPVPPGAGKSTAIDSRYAKRLAVFDQLRSDFLCDDAYDLMIWGVAYGQTLPPDLRFKELLEGEMLELTAIDQETTPQAALVLSEKGQKQLAHYRTRRAGF